MTLRGLIDIVADASVVGSYSRLGFRLRAPTFAPLPRADGKVVVVTGATSGIGFAASRALVDAGAHVVLVGRDAEKLRQAQATLSATTNATATATATATTTTTRLCDLADLTQVLALAASLPPIDVLVHNAGVLNDARVTTLQGEEAGFATHVLAPYLLTRSVEKKLKPGARVLWVSSGGQYTQKLDLKRCRANEGEFDGVTAYAQQKRAQVLLNELFAKRLAAWNIRSNAMHPGWAKTPGVDKGLPRFTKIMAPLLRSADEGADTLVWLAIADVDATGQLFLDRVARRTEILPGTRHSDVDKRQLWDLCARLTGVA